MAPHKPPRRNLTTRQNTLILEKHRALNPFFTPTHLQFIDPHSGEKAGSWSSRRARKGRYVPRKHKIHYIGPGSSPSSPDDSEKGAGRGKKIEAEAEGEIQKMEQVAYGRMKSGESKFKPHLKADVSFWIAVSFTLGSVVWVVNGFLVWFPILRPELDTTAFSRTAAATAFIGGSIFEVGSYLMVVEALDRGRETNFGTALGQILHHRRHVPQHPHAHSATSSIMSEIKDDLKHPSSSRSTSTGGEGEDQVQREGENEEHIDGFNRPGEGAKGYIWWGKPLWHDLGYLAAIIQLFAATIFWISTLTGLPGVIPGFADGAGSRAIIDVFFWTPQVVGGTGFIISALILMVEVQKKWWLPNVADVGWQVGAWNLIGAIGFTLCGALGYPSTSSTAEYQSGLSTFWGSWAFLIGSIFQLGEVVWREKPAS